MGEAGSKLAHCSQLICVDHFPMLRVQLLNDRPDLGGNRLKHRLQICHTWICRYFNRPDHII